MEELGQPWSLQIYGTSLISFNKIKVFNGFIQTQWKSDKNVHFFFDPV